MTASCGRIGHYYQGEGSGSYHRFTMDHSRFTMDHVPGLQSASFTDPHGWLLTCDELGYRSRHSV